MCGMPLPSRITVTWAAEARQRRPCRRSSAASREPPTTTTTVATTAATTDDGDESQKDTAGDDDTTHPARLGHRRTTTRGRAVRQTWTLPLADGCSAATGFSPRRPHPGPPRRQPRPRRVGRRGAPVAALRACRRCSSTSASGSSSGSRASASATTPQQLTQVLGYAALVLILVEGGITTQWSGIRRSVAPAAVLATVGVGRVGARRRGGRARAARLVVADRLPRRRRARVDGCRGGVLGAAPGAAPPADLGDARGGVGLQRRAGRAARHRARGRPRPRRDPAPVVAGRPRRGRRAGRRRRSSGWRSGGAAPGCCASSRRRRPRCSPSAWCRWRCWRTPPPTSVHASGFLACYLAALVLGNLAAPAPARP